MDMTHLIYAVYGVALIGALVAPRYASILQNTAGATPPPGNGGPSGVSNGGGTTITTNTDPYTLVTEIGGGLLAIVAIYVLYHGAIGFLGDLSKIRSQNKRAEATAGMGWSLAEMGGAAIFLAGGVWLLLSNLTTHTIQAPQLGS